MSKLRVDTALARMAKADEWASGYGLEDVTVEHGMNRSIITHNDEGTILAVFGDAEPHITVEEYAEPAKHIIDRSKQEAPSPDLATINRLKSEIFSAWMTGDDLKPATTIVPFDLGLVDDTSSNPMGRGDFEVLQVPVRIVDGDDAYHIVIGHEAADSQLCAWFVHHRAIGDQAEIRRYPLIPIE